MGWNTRIAVRGGLIGDACRRLRGTNYAEIESKSVASRFWATEDFRLRRSGLSLIFQQCIAKSMIYVVKAASP